MTDIGDLYNDLAAGYDEHYDTPHGRAENTMLTGLIVEQLDRAATRNGTRPVVVDAGCGTGLLLDLIPLLPNQYVGFDVSLGMLNEAARKHPAHQFIHTDVTDPVNGMMALGPNRATLIVGLFDVVSYVDPELLARQMETVLAPGGRFLLMAFGPRRPRQPGIVTVTKEETYTTLRLRRTFETVHGLRVEECFPMTYWAAPRLPARLIPSYYQLEWDRLRRNRSPEGHQTIVIGSKS